MNTELCIMNPKETDQFFVHTLFHSWRFIFVNLVTIFFTEWITVYSSQYDHITTIQFRRFDVANITDMTTAIGLGSRYKFCWGCVSASLMYNASSRWIILTQTQ